MIGKNFQWRIGWWIVDKHVVTVKFFIKEINGWHNATKEKYRLPDVFGFGTNISADKKQPWIKDDQSVIYKTVDCHIMKSRIYTPHRK